MPSVSLPFKIRPFFPGDLDAILGIQSTCQSISVWSSRDYQELAADPMGTLLVACFEGHTMSRILGFSVFHRVDSEAELRNIAVAPESNLPALELYRKFGFEPQGRRKEYYRHPTEDALVLACRILPSDG